MFRRGEARLVENESPRPQPRIASQVSSRASHHRSEFVVGIGHYLRDDAGGLRDARELELENRKLREVCAKTFDVGLCHLRGRKPGIEERERERNLLRDPLWVKLAMRALTQEGLLGNGHRRVLGHVALLRRCEGGCILPIRK